MKDDKSVSLPEIYRSMIFKWNIWLDRDLTHWVHLLSSDENIQQQDILYTLHSTFNNLHSTFNNLHSTLYTSLSTLNTLHSTLYIKQSTLYTLHSTLYTLHSTLYTLHSTLYTPSKYYSSCTLHSLSLSTCANKSLFLQKCADTLDLQFTCLPSFWKIKKLKLKNDPKYCILFLFKVLKKYCVFALSNPTFLTKWGVSLTY